MEVDMTSTERGHEFHRLTIAAMADSLQRAAKILVKAERHAAKNKIGLDVLLQSRLFPDMFNLLQQLQYVCFIPVDFARHFTDAAAPRVGYDETQWAELSKSIGKTTDYLRAISPARVSERAARIVPLFFDGAKGLTALDYAGAVIIPDFYFHLTAAYAILRHNGVPLGKADFLGLPKTVPIKSKR
jgi:hypothetical protein